MPNILIGRITNTYRRLRIRQRLWFRKYRWLPFAIAVLVYMLATAYYMTPQVLHCQTTLYGFGDNTAGPIWRNLQPEQSLLGSYTGMTNYPYGENLYSPVGFSYIGQTIVIKAFSSVAGAICGYNLVNMMSFVLTAVVLFGLVYTLTRSFWIALLAGYAAAFAPYFQMKIGGHPGYGFSAILIGIIWLFLRIITHRRLMDALLFGLVTAISFYFDPYFVLLAALAIMALVIGWLIMQRAEFVQLVRRQLVQSSSFRSQLKLLVLAAATIVVLMLPLGIAYYSQRNVINADVAASRGNVLAEARACSNWPQEYLVPFPLNPVFQTIFGKTRYINTENVLRNNFSCGIGEDSIGLSLTLLAISGIGMLILGWEKLNGRRLRLAKLTTFPIRLVLLGAGLVALLAAAIGFPPLQFHGIPTPSYELLHVTSTWRTLTRVYVLVNIGLVIIASVVLAYFAAHFAKRKRLLLIGFVIVFVGIFVEYQAFPPFQGNTLSTFDYTKDVPSAYVWLKQQPSIYAVAEYPIEREGGESDAGSYYLTMQTVHGKRLFNSALSTSPQETLRSGLKNLADPQTIPVLRALGIDAIIIHGVPADQVAKLPYIKVLYEAPQSPFNLLSHTPTVKYDNIVIASISDAPPASFVAILGDGFARNTTIIFSAVDWQYEAIQDSRLTIEALSSQRAGLNNQPHLVCFEAKMSVPSESDTLDLRADGTVVTSGLIDGQYRQFMVTATHQVELHNHTGHNMRVTHIGCGA